MDTGTRSILRTLLAMALCTLAATTTAVRAQAARTPAVTTLAPILVEGSVPGPALWKVSRGNHVLWILGITGPLPRKMHWEATRVQALIRQSQEVIARPELAVKAQVGFWKGLSLLPHLIGVKKLPDGKTLQDTLPAPLYHRWEVQRKRYLGGIKGWHDDRLRPVFAASELYTAAIKANGLTNDDRIAAQVVAYAKRDHIGVVTPKFEVTLKDPGSLLRRFKESDLHDQICLSDTLDAVEHDLAQTTARANAWATGNLRALQQVLAVPQQDACVTALSHTTLAAQAGLGQLRAKARQTWIGTATAALQHNATSLALLSMNDLLAHHGYLDGLAAEGDTVTAPPGIDAPRTRQAAQ